MTVRSATLSEADVLPVSTGAALALPDSNKGSGWLKQWFSSLLRFRPRCPDCGTCAMVCRYEVPADYAEVAPRYYQCDSCAARYLRVSFGSFIDASGREFDRCYATAPHIAPQRVTPATA